MATALLIGGLALSVVGTGVSIASSIQQGRTAEALRDAEAAAARNQASLVRAQAAVEAAQRERAGRRAQGAREAAFAASGIALEGSALSVLADAAFEEELGVALTRFQGEQRAFALMTGAELSEFQGDAARSAATQTAIAQGISGFGSTLLTGGLALGGAPATGIA